MVKRGPEMCSDYYMVKARIQRMEEQISDKSSEQIIGINTRHRTIKTYKL